MGGTHWGRGAAAAAVAPPHPAGAAWRSGGLGVAGGGSVGGNGRGRPRTPRARPPAAAPPRARLGAAAEPPPLRAGVARVGRGACAGARGRREATGRPGEAPVAALRRARRCAPPGRSFSAVVHPCASAPPSRRTSARRLLSSAAAPFASPGGRPAAAGAPSSASSNPSSSLSAIGGRRHTRATVVRGSLKMLVVIRTQTGKPTQSAPTSSRAPGVAPWWCRRPCPAWPCSRWATCASATPPAHSHTRSRPVARLLPARPARLAAAHCPPRRSYPAYLTYKALERRKPEPIRTWCEYWCAPTHPLAVGRCHPPARSRPGGRWPARRARDAQGGRGQRGRMRNPLPPSPRPPAHAAAPRPQAHHRALRRA